MKVQIIAFSLIAITYLGACNNAPSTKSNTAATAIDTTSVVYTCPMHPEVRSNKPGNCPKCNMDLEKVSKTDTTAK